MAQAYKYTYVFLSQLIVLILLAYHVSKSVDHAIYAKVHLYKKEKKIE
jgi:hypothetical protein